MTLTCEDGFGYCGQGTYRCFCGVVIYTTPNNQPTMATPVTMQAIKDQWEAHKNAR